MAAAPNRPIVSGLAAFEKPPKEQLTVITTSVRAAGVESDVVPGSGDG